jgi:hypothetical protein
MAIFEEQVLEPFVNRGVGNSGVASRQIQAGNLPDLQAAVRQSGETQANIQRERENQAKSSALLNYRNTVSGGSGGGGSSKSSSVADSSIPVLIGKRSGGQLTPSSVQVAIPDGSGGYTVESLNTGYSKFGGSKSNSLEMLKSLGIDVRSINDLPEMTGNVLNGRFSKATIMSELLKAGGGKISLSDISKRLIGDNAVALPTSQFNLDFKFAGGSGGRNEKKENEAAELDLRNEAARKKDQDWWKRQGDYNKSYAPRASSMSPVLEASKNPVRLSGSGINLRSASNR